MKTDDYITLDGASLSVAHVLSFESEKAFIDAYENELYKDLAVIQRKQKLKSIYRKAKLSIPEA